MGQSYITKAGLEKLKEEFEQLKKVKMPEVIERSARAKELGDLSENAEYHDAKDEQGFIAGRIMELENLINKAEIIKSSNGGDVVGVGSTVKVRCDDTSFTYSIVGSNEANPTEGRISNESPIGRAFLGAKRGEKIVVQIPRGKMECEVLEIL